VALPVGYMSFDVIVVGLGAMGSATAYHLARRGLNVLGVDQYVPGHAHGSSHGDSRIIRELYYEHPLYVPLVQRAYALWAELERESGDTLLHLPGGLMLGRPDAGIVVGSRAAAIEHGIAYESLDADAIRARCPSLHPPEDFVGVWDKRAGYVEPETATAAHLRLAARAGATLKFNEPVVEWSADGVTTAEGRYAADRIVLAAGAWMTSLVPELPLVVERQVLVWLDPAYAGDKDPIYLCEHEPGKASYWFPRLAAGVKAALYHEGEIVSDLGAVRRSVEPQEIDQLRQALAPITPPLACAPARYATTCLFTNTPDGRFVIDRHPAIPSVVIVSPCSGHGFKFASAIGEASADLATDRQPFVPLHPFAVSRLTMR
jgi:sarcosine oxidase